MASNYTRQTRDVSTGDFILASDIETEMDYLYGTVLNGGASTGIGANDLMNGGVGSTQLATSAVTTAKIADSTGASDGVTEAKLADDAVTADKLATDAVVDDSIDTSGAFSMFGAWATQDSTPAVFVAGGIYKAGTDGFVTAISPGVSCAISGYTDGSNPPTTRRNYARDTGGDGLTMPVRKDDYWKITLDIGTLLTIQWLPIGTGECIKQ